MKAFILAGGLGTRLRPLTETVPKPMILIYGKPFISYQIKLLASQGIKNIIVSTGYLGEQIEAYLGNGSKFGVSITYSPETAPLGSGGALIQAKDLIDDDVLILNGDDIVPIDWLDFLSKVERNTIVVHPSESNGNVSLDEKTGKVKEYSKELDSNWTHAGLSFFRKETLVGLPKNIFSLEEEFIQPLSSEGKLYYYQVFDITLSIGTLQRLEETSQNLNSYLTKYLNEKTD